MFNKAFSGKVCNICINLNIWTIGLIEMKMYRNSSREDKMFAIDLDQIAQF